MSKNRFYAIKTLNKIVESWEECRPLVVGVKGVIYKRFNTKEKAQNFLKQPTKSVAKSTKSSGKSTKPSVKLPKSTKKGQKLAKKAPAPVQPQQSVNSVRPGKTVSYQSETGISGTITIANDTDPFRYQHTRSKTIYAVDGSYNKETNFYGAAVIQFKNKTDALQELGITNNNPDLVVFRNVAGECLAFSAAINMATAQQQTKITIICDFDGLYRWTAPKEITVNNQHCCGIPKNPAGQFHRQALVNAVAKGLKTINFIWVKSHKGVAANVAADKLARQACKTN